MRDETASVVYPLIRTALRLREVLRNDSAFESGRGQLAERFRELHRLFPAIPAGDVRVEAAVDLLAPPPETESDGRYLGIAYPLACWVDELFLLGSNVAVRWNEQKFEVDYHASNDRAWRFWQQARLAGLKTTDDDLEVFFLCASLGFRGEWADDAKAYRSWFGATRDRLLKSLRVDWAGPIALDPPPTAAPRFGSDRVRRMGIVAGMTALVAIPVCAVLMFRLLAG
jgi:type VI secretion system protein ImpK